MNNVNTIYYNIYEYIEVNNFKAISFKKQCYLYNSLKLLRNLPYLNIFSVFISGAGEGQEERKDACLIRCRCISQKTIHKRKN